jgi:hypothetical protein
MSVDSRFCAAVGLAAPLPLCSHRKGARRRPYSRILVAILLGASSVGIHAASLLPAPSLPLNSFEGFRAPAKNWGLAEGLKGDPRRDKTLQVVPGVGVLVDIPTATDHDSLQTAWEHGDMELDLDFLLPVGSNSGVYLQGRYEVQLFDSWGVKIPKCSDCGGIYEQWDASKPVGQQGFGGHAPKANACRAPGLWQHLHVEFTAPRFDATGKKISNARFVNVTLNGFVVQENVEVPGCTRGAAFSDEKPTGPLIIQGDHGPVALRKFAAKRFGSDRVMLKDLTLKFYEGSFGTVAEYEGHAPKREAAITQFTGAVTNTDGRGAAVFLGAMTVPLAGDYAFEGRGVYTMHLTVDNQPVILPNPGGRQLGQVKLTAGVHSVRIDLPQGAQRNVDHFSLWTEGPEMPPHLLGATTEPKLAEVRVLPVEPVDRILVQRTFTPFDGVKRIYTVAVGTPAGIHYGYDLESAAILRVWRGSFLDAAHLWIDRAEDQIGEPTGPLLTLGGKPLLALFADGESLWPSRPAAPAHSTGYRLEPNGQPTFLYEYVGVSVADRIAPLEDGHGLVRHLRVTGTPWERSLWMLVTESSSIVAQPGGYLIGDREYYIDWPADATLQPMIRTNGGAMQLVVPLPNDGVERDITYNLVW